jgi:hypothetical protein
MQLMRSLVVLSAVTAAFAGGGLAVAARPAPRAAGPQLTVEPEAASPGGAVVLSGRGFPRNAEIELLAGPPHSAAEQIGSAQTGRRGAFRATIRIRSQADAGQLVALACYDACRVKASARFRIARP